MMYKVSFIVYPQYDREYFPRNVVYERHFTLDGLDTLFQNLKTFSLGLGIELLESKHVLDDRLISFQGTQKGNKVWVDILVRETEDPIKEILNETFDKWKGSV